MARYRLVAASRVASGAALSIFAVGARSLSVPGGTMAEMDEVVAALTREREAVLARLAALTGDFDRIVDSSRDSNADDEHDPEGATIAFERSQVDALIRQARAHLLELDAASARVENGSYGVCERCGGTIARARLAARPTALTCVTC